MTKMRQAWYEMMKAKYNTDEAGVRKIMQERQKKSMESPKRKETPHVGGFNTMTIERLRELSSAAGKTSKRPKADA